MKSFSGDEGYQAPSSPRLIEQEFYIANYVVCIPLVSTVVSGEAQSAVLLFPLLFVFRFHFSWMMKKKLVGIKLFHQK